MGIKDYGLKILFLRSFQLILLLVLVFCLYSVFDLNSRDIFKFKSLFFGGLLVFFSLFVYRISNEIKNDKTAILIIFIISLLFLGSWNFYVKPTPINDYGVLWDGAKQILNGTFSDRAFKKDDYFCFYNFQIGYATWLAFLLKIFNHNLSLIVFFEGIVISLTNVVLYKSARLYLPIQASVVSCFCFLFFPFVFLGSGILNNQHECLLLEAIAIFLVLNNAKKLNANSISFFVGIILCIANILRPTAIVVLLACVLFQLIDKNSIKKGILNAGIIIFSYFVTYKLFDLVFIYSGLAPYGIMTSNLWFKLMLGLTGNGVTEQRTTSALYTNLYYDLKHFGFNYELYKQEAQKAVLNLFTQDKLNSTYIIRKMVYFCGYIDNQYHFLGSKVINKNSTLILNLNSVGILLYAFLILKSLFEVIKKEFISNEVYILCGIVFVGYFFSYIFLEVQPRYRFEQYYVLILMTPFACKHCFKQTFRRSC